MNLGMTVAIYSMTSHWTLFLFSQILFRINFRCRTRQTQLFGRTKNGGLSSIIFLVFRRIDVSAPPLTCASFDGRTDSDYTHINLFFRNLFSLVFSGCPACTRQTAAQYNGQHAPSVMRGNCCAHYDEISQKYGAPST